MVGVELKDTIKAKSGRKKDLLLAASKGNTGDLSQSSVSANSKTEASFKLRVHAYS